MMEKQGPITRDTGSCVLTDDLEAQRADWRNAARIIVKAQFLLLMNDVGSD